MKKMYSPHAQKFATSIMYVKQLEHRVRIMPIEGLEAEIKDYENKMNVPERRNFLKRFFDEVLGVDSIEWDQYEINRRIFRERNS